MQIEAGVAWGAPLSPKAVDGTVGRLVGGRRGLYVAVQMISL